MYYIVLAAVLMTALGSCSSQIVGKWEISKYSTITADEDSPSMTNAGTMTFEREGKGINDISFSILGSGRDEAQNFTWKMGENHIRITNEDGTERVWIIVESKRSSQKWKFVDQDNNIHVLELKN